MTVIEHRPSRAEILDFINDSLRQLQEAGAEARYIVMGPDAYGEFRQAMAERFHRKPKDFETYNYVPIVVDPFRADAVCVLPAPGACAKGVQGYRMT